MNKTIIININGLIFHIEEDAYEILQNYMNDIKRHFSNTADSMEITGDIENRIAEMFTEILKRENRQVIVITDIQEVIAQMGTTADFVVDEEDMDAAESFQHSGTSRRLFRDPDDHLLGGVCAGIANYFDIQAAWIRLAFILAVLVAGTGILAYIILWIVIPKANSRVDRMAMKGEKINLQGFKRNFEEEVKNVRSVLSDTHKTAKPFLYKCRDFIGDFFEYLGAFLRGTGSVILKIIGVFILVIGFGAIIGFTALFITVLVFGKNPDWLFPFNIISSSYAHLIYSSAYLLALIPVIAIILFAIRVFFNKAVFNRGTGFVLLIVWIASLTTLLYYGSKTAADFRSQASFSQQINITPVNDNTFYLKVNDIKEFTSDDSVKLGINQTFNGKIILDDEEWNVKAPGNVSISIEKADLKSPVLIETIRAKGRNYEDALSNARNTTYRFIQQDSLLTFDSRLRNNHNALWRDQKIELTLKVPLNTTLVVEEEISRFEVYGANIWDCQDRDDNKSEHFAKFLMTENGLECIKDTLKHQY